MVPGVLVVLAFAALAILGRESSGAVVGKAAYGAQYQYPHEFLVGTGGGFDLGGQPQDVHVTAQRSPSQGTGGQYWISAGTGTIRGRVTCLRVIGNHAAARGPVEESSNPAIPVGTLAQIQVTDNGSPGELNDTEVTFFFVEPQDACPFLPFGEPPITQGNFVVHDDGA